MYNSDNNLKNKLREKDYFKPKFCLWRILSLVKEVDMNINLRLR